MTDIGDLGQLHAADNLLRERAAASRNGTPTTRPSNRLVIDGIWRPSGAKAFDFRA